jgi:hypothetical protein
MNKYEIKNLIKSIKEIKLKVIELIKWMELNDKEELVCKDIPKPVLFKTETKFSRPLASLTDAPPNLNIFIYLI